MRIAEFFHSFQGEGRFVDTPSIFVRTSGCNLRCSFCDTPYASWEPEGDRIAWPQLLQRVLAIDCEHVVITGGEPMLIPEMVEFTRDLERAGRFITIETAGTIDRPVTAQLMSISPKLSNSTPSDGTWWKIHEQRRHQPQVIRRLVSDYPYQLKFVVDHPQDLKEIDRYLNDFPEIAFEHVFLMPQATTREELAEKSEWVCAAAVRAGFQFSPRLHIERFGNQRGV